MERYYKHEFRLNASHGSMLDSSSIHSHTFVVSIKTNFVKDDIEKIMISKVKDFLDIFEGQNLLQMDYFGGAYPSVETIGDLFYESLRLILSEIDIELYELGVFDNPMTTYYVSDRIMLPNLNDNISNKNYELLNKLIKRID